MRRDDDPTTSLTERIEDAVEFNDDDEDLQRALRAFLVRARASADGAEEASIAHARAAFLRFCPEDIAFGRRVSGSLDSRRPDA